MPPASPAHPQTSAGHLCVLARMRLRIDVFQDTRQVFSVAPDAALDVFRLDRNFATGYTFSMRVKQLPRRLTDHAQMSHAFLRRVLRVHPQTGGFKYPGRGRCENSGAMARHMGSQECYVAKKALMNFAILAPSVRSIMVALLGGGDPEEGSGRRSTKPCGKGIA